MSNLMMSAGMRQLAAWALLLSALAATAATAQGTAPTEAGNAPVRAIDKVLFSGSYWTDMGAKAADAAGLTATPTAQGVAAAARTLPVRGRGVGAVCRTWRVPPRSFDRFSCRAGLTCCANAPQWVFPKSAGAVTAAASTNNNNIGSSNFTMGVCAQQCPPACNTLLTAFTGASTPGNALLMSTLVADVTVIQELINDNRPFADKEAELRRKWASYGADAASIKITPFRPPAGEDALVTVGAMFTAGSMSYVIVGWVIGFNNNAEPADLVPFAGNEDQQVRAVMYNYYQFIESTGFIREAKTLSQNRDVVFAGLSAGAAVSQFAALDSEFARVRGVFLFGVQRIGNAAFQANYAAQRGAFTSSWWNKFDAWPIVPVEDDAELALLPAEGIDRTIEPRLRMLDARFWWRVNPYTSACERMTGALAEPCGRAGDATCTLNVEDHEPKAQFDSLKACVGTSATCRLSILAA